MNIHTAITTIAIIAIIIPFTYSGMNIYAAEQLEYRWTEPGKFSFFEMSNNRNIELCNSVPFPANFKNIKISTFYQMENKGTYTIENLEIGGSESKISQGKFLSENYVDSQHLFMIMDFQFDGGDNRIDARQLFVLVSIDTPIIGVIPYSVDVQYSGFDFDQLMNQENSKC